MTFNIGDILNRGRFSNLNLSAFIIEKHWDEEEDCWIYTIQHFINGNITSIFHDTAVALSHED